MLIVALVLFLVAAELSIRVNMPRGYRDADVEKLRVLTTREFWEARSEIGSRRAAELRVNVIASTRPANGRRRRRSYGPWSLRLPRSRSSESQLSSCSWPIEPETEN
jgi:hypothetical protein